MRDEAEKRGRAELSLRQGRLLVVVGLFSVAINILLLTGPLYMLQVYDRVLASRSEATLVALSGLVAFLFIVMGVLEYSRGRILSRIGAQLQDRLDYRVFSAAHRRLVQAPGDQAALAAQRDLEAVQRFWASWCRRCSMRHGRRCFWRPSSCSIRCWAGFRWAVARF
jgi:ATP-binding cassette subfamily C protein